MNTEFWSIRDSTWSAFQKNKLQNRDVFYYKIFVTRTSAFKFPDICQSSAFAQQDCPGLLHYFLRFTGRILELQPLCHVYLRRVALFSIAIHSLYLLHVQHFSLRSCEPPETQKILVRLFTKNGRRRGGREGVRREAFLTYYLSVWHIINISSFYASVISYFNPSVVTENGLHAKHCAEQWGP